MKRRFFALLGILSPFILLISCLLIMTISGLAGWLLFSQSEGAQKIRIISLAPLRTPQAAAPASAPDQSSPADQTEPAAPPAVSQEAPASENQPLASQSATPDGEAADQPAPLDLPAGSVDALTQTGVASRLVIPKLELDAPVIVAPIENQSWKVDHLDQAVGHLEGTAPPGSNSNVVLAGHVTLAADVYGPFAGLAMLEPGDVVFIHQEGHRFKYMIEGYQTLPRTAVEVTFPTQTGQVTLITCSGWDDEAGRYLERVVVKGRLIEG